MQRDRDTECERVREKERVTWRGGAKRSGGARQNERLVTCRFETSSV